MDEEHMLQDLYRLTKENNRMLKAIRRDAFIGGIIKLAITIAFIVIPIWFYQEYLAPQVEMLTSTFKASQPEGTANPYLDFLDVLTGAKRE